LFDERLTFFERTKAEADALKAAAEASKKDADTAIVSLKAKIMDVKDLVTGKSKKAVESVKSRSKAALERVKNLSPSQKKKVAAGFGVGVFAGVGWFGVANQGTPVPPPAKK
jgi:hypothetical protein